jgi:multicomponent Na+:H+ antiporter subunit D
MTSLLLDWNMLPLAVVLSSFVPGIAIMFLREEQSGARSTLNLAGAVAKVLLVGLMLRGVGAGATYEWRMEVLPGLELSLVGDALALLFVTLSAVLWLVTTVYAIGYLEGSPNRTRFFAFFSLCVTATTGLALAGDLFTFVFFFEALTWATYPLVVHRGTPEAIRAGRLYLVYTLTAGAALVLGAVWFQVETGTVAFAEGGIVDPAAAVAAPARYFALFLLLLAGVGVKAAFFPVHGWLPIAMVAPAPVSALLHAVAVVKAGAFGVVRLLHSLFGIEVATQMGAAGLVAGLAAFTILYGSIRALRQDDLKRLLAFSTVSQLSYIALGVSLAAPMAQVGGLVHLIHQGILKITLFFCAGLLAETLDLKKVSDMGGVARRMPLTMLAFAVAAFGMIGIPPTPGFLSKWYLGVGALEAGAGWVVPVLLASSLLNAAYFLPILRTAYLDEPSGTWAGAEGRRTGSPREEGRRAGFPGEPARLEAPGLILFPALTVGLLAVAVGLLAGLVWSPLGWAELIVARGIQ